MVNVKCLSLRSRSAPYPELANFDLPDRPVLIESKQIAWLDTQTRLITSPGLTRPAETHPFARNKVRSQCTCSEKTGAPQPYIEPDSLFLSVSHYGVQTRFEARQKQAARPQSYLV